MLSQAPAFPGSSQGSAYPWYFLGRGSCLCSLLLAQGIPLLQGGHDGPDVRQVYHHRVQPPGRSRLQVLKLGKAPPVHSKVKREAINCGSFMQPAYSEECVCFQSALSEHTLHGKCEKCKQVQTKSSRN